jgi:hypothetical protein
MSHANAKDIVNVTDDNDEYDWTGFFKHSSKRQSSIKGSRILLPESVLTQVIER